MELSGLIPAGQYTTHDVLQVMKQYAQQDSTSDVVKQVAFVISGGVHPTDILSIAVSTRNWILTNMVYVKDHVEANRLFGFQEPDLEMVKSPKVVLESRRYDCDCAATLIASIMLALGIPVRFMAVAFHDHQITGPDAYSHVFAQVYDSLRGVWITIDPVSYPEESEMLNKVKQHLVVNI